jgi:putative transposase
MANAACDRLSELAWEAQEFGQYSMHKAFYRTIRDEFPLSAQVVVRLNSKVADAYKIDQKSQREFRKHGSICYDPRILSWKMDQGFASIWTLDGRQKIPFVCGDHHRELLAFQRGETDLVYRDKEWFLFTTVEVPDQKEREAIEWIGVDMGLVSIAETSDGKRFAGSTVNGRRARNARLRRKLQKKGTKSAKRLMRRRRRKEQRFTRDVNHQISSRPPIFARRTRAVRFRCRPSMLRDCDKTRCAPPASNSTTNPLTASLLRRFPALRFLVFVHPDSRSEGFPESTAPLYFAVKAP